MLCFHYDKNMNIKLEIQKMAKEIGISKIGFTTADDFDYLEKPFVLVSKKGEQQDLNIKILKSVFTPNWAWNQLKLSYLLLWPIRISCRNNPKKQNLSVAKSLQIHGA